MKILLLDIETAPHEAYTWGVRKQYITPAQIIKPSYVLCFAAKWLGKKGVIFRSVQENTALQVTKKARELLDEADAVVGYFSSGFDVPRLRMEFMWHGLKPPSPHKDIDLYKAVRKNFKGLPSYKLDYVLKWLDIGAKVKHEGFDLWKKCIEGDEKAWRTMKRYNIGDVKPLEDLYNRLLPWISAHPNQNVYNDNGVRVCVNCGSENVNRRGWQQTNCGKYERHRCMDCGKWMRGRHTQLSDSTKQKMLVGVS